MAQTIEEKREALIHKTFVMMFRILAIFGIPAAIAFFLGNHLDTTYNGGNHKYIFICLAVSFITSWVFMIRVYISITKEFAALKKEEQAANEIRQQEIKDKLNK